MTTHTQESLCGQGHTSTGLAYCGVCQEFRCSAQIVTCSVYGYRCVACGLPIAFFPAQSFA